MTAMNVVHMRVKPGKEDDYVRLHQEMDIRSMPGGRNFWLIRSGERSFVVVGEWDSLEAMANARPAMVANLDKLRPLLEDLGGGLAASFWLEAPLSTDDGAGSLAFTRRSTVSLSGRFGEIRLGRDRTANSLNDTIFDPFGGNGSGANIIGAVSAADTGLADQCHERHAHVQALVQGGARVVREAVQPDVHALQYRAGRAVPGLSVLLTATGRCDLHSGGRGHGCGTGRSRPLAGRAALAGGA